MELKTQLLPVFQAVRRATFWRVVLLLHFMTAMQGCQPKALTEIDIAGTYSLSYRGTTAPVMEKFDFVRNTENVSAPFSMIVLTPDHTLNVTNFPVLEPGTQGRFRWTPGMLVSTNGQWTMTTETQRNEIGTREYQVPNLVLQIPGRTIAGYLSLRHVTFPLEDPPGQSLGYERLP
jgi:hypothetical protein